MMGRPLLSLATQDVIQLQQSPLFARAPPLLSPPSAKKKKNVPRFGDSSILCNDDAQWHLLRPLGDSTAALQEGGGFEGGFIRGPCPVFAVGVGSCLGNKQTQSQHPPRAAYLDSQDRVESCCCCILLILHLIQLVCLLGEGGFLHLGLIRSF